MKRIVFFFLLFSLSLPGFAQDQEPATLNSVLLEQLRTIHNQKTWLVPANTAVEGLTPEQAKWKDSSGNHSVGQLAYHLVFWNQQELARFKGEPPTKYSGKNDVTFNDFDSKNWSVTVQQLDQVLTEWEQAVTAADDKKLETWAPTIARIGITKPTISDRSFMSASCKDPEIQRRASSESMGLFDRRFVHFAEHSLI
jgi:hypothetical protein